VSTHFSCLVGQNTDPPVPLHQRRIKQSPHDFSGSGGSSDHPGYPDAYEPSCPPFPQAQGGALVSQGELTPAPPLQPAHFVPCPPATSKISQLVLVHAGLGGFTPTQPTQFSSHKTTLSFTYRWHLDPPSNFGLTLERAVAAFAALFAGTGRFEAHHLFLHRAFKDVLPVGPLDGFQ
jgi:hypothetical protein